jgi:fibronectin-binding autotransporter adhesin
LAPPDNAIIGNGGAGGVITVGNVTAGSVLLDNFSGTYTLQGTGTTLTQSGGITIDTDAGDVTFRGTGASASVFTIAGAGGITMNGSGILNLRENLSMTYTGATAINSGAVMLGNAADRSSGNFNLNGGILTDYYRQTHAFTGGLGNGTNQIQIHGNSGFGGGNQTSTWRIGTAGSTLTWGTVAQGATGFFNPTTLRLRSAQGDNNGGSIWGWVTLDNRLDLNGAARTIEVYQGGGSIMQSRATISGGITGSGSASSLVKNGGGVLFIGGTTSNWGGSTTINGGLLDFGGTNIANIGGGSGRNITVAEGAGVRFNALSNAILNRIVETSNEITVMTGTTANNLDFSSSTGANLSNVWLGNWASNGAKAEISGTIAFGGSNYQLGARESAGLLGIVGTNKLTGSQGLTVGQTNFGTGVRVELAGANNFTGDTVINTGAKLTLGNNLAIQDSALNVGAAGGTIAFSTGVVSGRITGDSRSDSPTFGGLIGSRNLAAVFTATGGNNEQLLQSYQMLGFTLNTGTSTSHTYSGAITDFSRGTSLIKSGEGTQSLSGNNSYTGVTTINDGILGIGHANALGRGGSAGSSAGSTIINSGGTLDLNGTSGVVEPIILNGTGFGGNGALVNNSGTAASIDAGLASVQITDGGIYGAAPSISISGTGSGATATVTRGLTNGTITSITSGGTGWVVGDQFTVSGGGGSGAVFEVTSVSSGAITGWNNVHAGTGYTGAPTGVTRLTGNSAGTNTFVFNNTNFTVAGVTLTNAGSDYDDTTTVSFGSGAASAVVQYSSVVLASDSSIGGIGDIAIGAIVSETGGARALTKVGAGTVTLSASNTYTGSTNITGGTLALSGAGSISSSPLIQINSSTTLNVTGVTGGFTVEASQTVGGTGTILASGKTVTANGTLSPGNSPGTLTQDGGALQLGGGGALNWQVHDVDGAAGSGYDTVSLINGATLDLSLLSAVNPYNINLWSLSGTSPDLNGDAINFDNTKGYIWTLFSTSTAITAFDPSFFNIILAANNGTNGFSNALGGGFFSVGLADSDTDLVLNFTPVPEPRAALLGGLGLLALLRRRR